MENKNTGQSLISNLINLAFLVRFGNLLIVAVIQYTTFYFLLDKTNFSDFLLHFIVLATLCSAAGGYIINDYYDVKIDTINKPDRVLIDRKIHRRNALIWNGFLDVSAVVFALLVSYKMAFFVSVSVFSLWAYSNHFKRLPFSGNLIIAGLSALTVLLVPLHYNQLSLAVLVYASFSFLMTLIREAVKDMQDVKGDERFQCKTLPIIWGLRKTKQLVYAFVGILIVVIVSFLVIEKTYNVLLLSVIGGLIIFVVQLIKADTGQNFKKLSRLCKWIMLIGISSMALI